MRKTANGKEKAMSVEDGAALREKIASLLIRPTWTNHRKYFVAFKFDANRWSRLPLLIGRDEFRKRLHATATEVAGAFFEVTESGTAITLRVYPQEKQEESR